MYLGFAMHKIARMEDGDYGAVRNNKKKKMPIITRGAVRDYEEAEDNGEEDPMIAEVIEQEKPDKADKSKVEVGACPTAFTPSCCRILTSISVFSRLGEKARWSSADPA